MRSRRSLPFPWFIAGTAFGVLAGALIMSDDKKLKALTDAVGRRLRQLQGALDWSESEDEDDLVEDAHGDALVGDGFDDEIEDDQLAELEIQVLDALQEDDALSRRAIEIAALEEGMIELRGRVRSEDEAARAGTLAKAVDGVQTVVNRLRVRAPAASRRTRRVRRDVERTDVASDVSESAEEGGRPPITRP